VRNLARIVVLGALALLCRSPVFAQASIAGVVRDTSQAVLPGVTVEAASPALIEKVRSVVTDGSGVYRITDLRPGTYTVTFTLPGFAIVKREGVELTGSATFQVNAELRVGALEETVTVTGEAPVVDVQNVRAQAVLSAEVLAAIPTTRNYESLHILVPGVTVAAGSQDVGGTSTNSLVFFAAHGGQVRDSQVLVGGLSITDAAQNGGRSMYVPSTGSSQEVTVTTSGGLGEAITAGTVVNMVPKEGGNTFSGNLFASGATGGMQGSNIDDDLGARGLRAPGDLRDVFDYEVTFGGPFRRDRLWFLFNARFHGFDNWVPGMFHNKNAGDITKWTYEPDLSKPASNDSSWRGAGLRLTWQATPRNKFSVFYEDQLRCARCENGGGPTSSPETNGRASSHPNNLGQALWTSPVTNRLLLEAGFSVHQLRSGAARNPLPGFIPVSEQAGTIPGLSYRAINNTASSWFGNHVYRSALTYTTGAHSMKLGLWGGYYQLSEDSESDQEITYRFRNGIPNQLTQQAWPLSYWQHLSEYALYAQDQWTVSRLTLGGGLRYEHHRAYFPSFRLGPTLWIPTQQTFPAVEASNLHDISARGSAAYDLFGDGKTAVKVALGKYVITQASRESVLGGLSAIGRRIVGTTNRSWNDANRNFVPDCDLLSGVANGECGAWSNQNFGKPVVDTRLDPAISHGWGVRPYNWAFELGIQRELIPRVSVSATYFRRWFGNHLITDNQALTLADYTFFNLPLPADPRLPISGTVDGFFNVVPAKFGVIDNLVTSAKNYGDITQNWNGADFTFNARLRDMTMQGGVSTGRAFNDVCEVAAKVPSVLLTAYESGGVGTPGRAIPMGHCQMKQSFQTQIKFLGAYTVPRIDVQLAATLQNLPGREVAASYNAPNAVVAPLLGRNLSGNTANVNLQLLPPQHYYGERINQLDFRVSKILRFGGKRMQASLDLFNALNTNTILTVNSDYSPSGSWEIPTRVLPARLIKITGQFDF
jgi:hypothetical protein